MLHVVFTEDGIPGWIGQDPREGSEPVERDLMFLASHRRTAKGSWVKRTAGTPKEPTEAERLAVLEEERKGALVARDVALRQALTEEADPLFFKWQRGECSKEDWLTAVETLKARFPKP